MRHEGENGGMNSERRNIIFYSLSCLAARGGLRRVCRRGGWLVSEAVVGGVECESWDA